MHAELTNLGKGHQEFHRLIGLEKTWTIDVDSVSVKVDREALQALRGQDIAERGESFPGQSFGLNRFDFDFGLFFDGQ
jgi:hypothetical protein